MSTLAVTQAAETIGGEISGLHADDLLNDESIVASVVEALEARGVLVFPDINLDPETQVTFCQQIGEVDFSEGHHSVPGIYRVSRDATKNSNAEYLKGTFHWHIDGCTPLHGEPPQKATVLSAKAVAESGGETEFASTYAAYDALSEDEKERFETFRVLHSLEASQRLVYPDPTPKQLEGWRIRPTSVHPLVWTHRSGRKSLLISAHADHIVDMDPDESRSLLDELMERATKDECVYRHHWSVGDTVIWDNTGVMHRSTPYPAGSPREMLRTTIFGSEPIQ
ncbi:MAG TPA: TauD/TfdA family dioxygenase [Acidimicrobiales bacterium]|nr:TauD/TfdA family dioxygenase [Acidimicrobiales bacterium]